MSVDDLVGNVAGVIGLALVTHEEGANLTDAPLEEAARSAILAVLEGISKPTQAMHDAAHDALDSRQDHSGCDIYATWPAMIDALRASVEKEDV